MGRIVGRGWGWLSPQRWVQGSRAVGEKSVGLGRGGSPVPATGEGREPVTVCLRKGPMSPCPRHPCIMPPSNSPPTPGCPCHPLGRAGPTATPAPFPGSLNPGDHLPPPQLQLSPRRSGPRTQPQAPATPNIRPSTVPAARPEYLSSILSPHGGAGYAGARLP